ncbi:hypothetical protein ACYULU_15600 [Breznakiellaceae bacterium SP9]
MADKDEQTRETQKLFDLMFKFLLKEASPGAIVHFINGLFGKDYPQDASVTFAATESVEIQPAQSPKLTKKLGPIQSDMILVLNGDAFLLEAQIDDDETIALRAFQYGFAYARQTKTISKDKALITLLMPDTRIIYWETYGKTPDKVTLRLVFPDRSEHDYEIETFKMLNQSLETLEERKMLLLLPFCLLKFRKEVKKRSTTKEKRQQLAEQMHELLLKLEAMIERGKKLGFLSSGDVGMLLDRISQMHKELYTIYPEFMEEQMQLEERLKSRSVEQERYWKMQSVEQERYWKKYAEEREREGKLKGELKGKREERNQIVNLIKTGNVTIEQLIEQLTQEAADTPSE